ncbi:MAG TPA: UDP-2,3-diacylglucosamine diphosphatase [bacterium]|nr:UDP-2,3-diacylglucosamine diphosphatase [bacterium]HPJ71977.1 UDP-2,3-diacylglucosamine diphosphatase [bacterium]
MPSKPIYFVSDAHLGIGIEGGEGRGAALESFLRKWGGGASRIFIVGDLFDFWIEYRYAVRPDYFRPLHALRSLVEAGVEVHYCQGNHDFALGPFVSETVGVTVHDREFRGKLQGRNVRVRHGDGIRPGDRGSRFLHRLLRNPALQRLYRLLPPAAGVPLGEFISARSRRFELTRATEEVLGAYRVRAREYLREGDDLVILGHTHCPELSSFPEGTYGNTGCWVKRYTLIRLLDGRPELLEFFPGEDRLETYRENADE